MSRVSGTSAMPLREITWAAKAGDVRSLVEDLRRVCGGVRPVMQRSVVVLPAPLRPSRATTSPSLTLSERPCRMWPSP